MPPAETARSISKLEPDLLDTASKILRGWGGGEGVRARLLRPRDAEEVRDAIAVSRSRRERDPYARGLIARGMGRSYGDAAQLAGGMVLDMTAMKGFELDEAEGTVRADAGVTIGELLAALVPAGWILPVVPGTQHVSVGGAIASDIHGKNHQTAGTFASHVNALELMGADGEVMELAPGADDGLLEATIGGMGLTGTILSARIRVSPVRGALLSVDTDRVSDLDDAMAALRVPGGPHRVAWLDLLGPDLVRGVVTRAGHAGENGQSRYTPTVRARATVPARWPGGLLRPRTVRAYNEFRYRTAPRRERGRPQGYGAHMFPLDSLDGWFRLYGKRGLLQYQLAVPTGSESVLKLVLERLRRGRIPCFLAVLKDLGEANDAHLSFPLAGWTLALDLPRAAPGIEHALSALDELVAGAGGHVYLTKDARMRPEALNAMYPRIAEWRAIRDRMDPDRLWRSDLALRTGLISQDGR